MIIRTAICLCLITAPAFSAGWSMKGRDIHNTGRADFSIPAGRLNSSFFDIFLWQKRTPGSPGQGNLSSTSMTFFDGAGPGGVDVVVGGYHWPKGVQGMNRQTGGLLWNGNPGGGESIGTNTAAFSNDGTTVYVTNDATAHPLMAFSTSTGPGDFWHNGDDVNPNHMGSFSPRISPDGRVFLHSWVDRPYAALDNGNSLTEVWAAATPADCGLSDPVLYNDAGTLLVIIGARWGGLLAYDGLTGQQLWSRPIGATVDAAATVDPSNGNVYVAAGSDDIYVAGLDADGQPLWSTPALKLYDYNGGPDGPQRAQSAGCLSHDGATYYFQSNGPDGQGRLYAVNTSNGTLKWSYDTGSRGWEIVSSSPIVTPNGIVIVGNNDGGTWFAIRDAGGQGQLVDSFQAADGGNARASATLSDDGLLYLPLRTIQTAGAAGGESPSYTVQNLFTAIDLAAGASARLWPPGGQQAVAGNGSVTVSWEPLLDPTGQFDHYAIYRDTAPFTSIASLTPIGAAGPVAATQYIDNTAVNGQAYYYAVTSVAIGGGEVTDVASIGPRVPGNASDLQVVCVARTPRYPRYAPDYTYYEITEPSGFGPYGFSAATGLGQGQSPATQRWPNIGDPVTFTATIRNRGTNTWSPTIHASWRLDGAVVAEPVQTISLAPGATTTFAWVFTWDGADHDIRFTIEESDDRPANNTLDLATRSVAFLSYIDQGFYQDYRASTAGYPGAATDDFIDWLNRHMTRFNELFADAGCPKRVHFDVLELLPDSAPDPAANTIDFAIFPFRYHAGDGSLRLSGYYHPDDDIDYGLLHEMGHQLGLIDIYQLDIPPDLNQVSGQGYSALPDLMHGVSPLISAHSAGAMTLWQDQAHGYYGQYLYRLPSELRLRLLGYDGQPLNAATVKMYQYCERPGQGKLITNQIKAQGTTDAAGEWSLPNVPIDTGMVPPIHTGDALAPNPFGYVAVVGTNGVLHFRVEHAGGVDYCWLDITEANIAYFSGQTATAVFERQLALGGPVQYVPPADMAELNAGDWDTWAQGSDPLNTYVGDDTTRTLVGSGSVRFDTDGGFDTYLRYPRNQTAQWNLLGVQTLNISFYAVNPNFSFQGGSPWIRLKDADGNCFEYQYYQNGGIVDLLNQAANQWRSYQIPIQASPSENNDWRRTVHGTPDLAHIQFVEIHADTWGYGFTLWVDGVGFSPRPIRSDFDRDGDVDVDDIAFFDDCSTGPAIGPIATGCEPADLDGDGDVDQSDFAGVQRCYSGPGGGIIPDCEGP